MSEVVASSVVFKRAFRLSFGAQCTLHEACDDAAVFYLNMSSAFRAAVDFGIDSLRYAGNIITCGLHATMKRLPSVWQLPESPRLRGPYRKRQWSLRQVLSSSRQPWSSRSKRPLPLA